MNTKDTKAKLELDPFLTNQLKSAAGQVALGAYMEKIGLPMERFTEFFLKMNEEQRIKFFEIFQKYYDEASKILAEELTQQAVDMAIEELDKKK